MCKEIRVRGQARFDPHPVMRLSAILHCIDLYIHYLDLSVAVNDVVEWMERDKPKQWNKSTYIEVKLLGTQMGFQLVLTCNRTRRLIRVYQIHIQIHLNNKA